MAKAKQLSLNGKEVKSTNGANLGFEQKLWTAADKLRNNVDAAEYKHVVLGLIFLKYISDAFSEVHTELKNDPEKLADPEDVDEYRARNAFWVPAKARWEHLQKNAKQPTIGVTVDDAMDAIERENSSLKGVLPKNYAREGLDKQRLGELIDLVSTIGLGDKESRSKDILGRVYEYFLGQFADAEGKKGGQFYTPRSIVQLLVAMIEPYKGRVFDPCCGSGGMFIQSEKFVEAHRGRLDDIFIFGQESNQTTWRLCKMDLAIRGIESKEVRWNNEGSFLNDLHKDLRADYLLANPPFNDSDWKGEMLREDVRWKYGVPPTGNANFAWVQHFIYHLAPHGIGGFVLANGSMSSNISNEGEIRKNIMESDLVDCMVALPSQLFYNTPIPACLWFIARDKENSKFKDRRGEVLFIDARKFGALVDRKHRELTQKDITKIADVYHAWRGELVNGQKVAYDDVLGFCRAVKLDEIRQQGHILTPGRYVGAEEEEDDAEAFEERMNPFEREFCERVEFLKSTPAEKEGKISFYATELPKLLQRGKALCFLEKVGKSTGSSFRRIERIFVPPNEFSTIKEFLEKNKVIFIVGDPEIGKTYTAARIMWEYYLKGYNPIWHSGSEPQERANVRKKLSECEVPNGSITYFEDPFGKIRFEDREDLRRTIDCVISRIQGIDAYVIITSREEVFKEFEKEKLSQNDLRKFTIEMRLMKPSYTDEKMKQMLLEWANEFECKWLKDENLESSIVSLAITSLRTPLSLWDFALSSRNEIDIAKIIDLINEKSRTVKAAFAEEIAQMPAEKILFLSLAVILNSVKQELIKPIFHEISKEYNLKSYSDSFEILQRQFAEKINIEERSRGGGSGFYLGFTHPSYEEGLVDCWNRQEIKDFVLKIFSSLIKNSDPMVRGCCGLCLMKNLSAISFKTEAYNLIGRVLHDKSAITRYGVAEAVVHSFLNIPENNRSDYLRLLLRDRHREIRATAIGTVSRNFKNIALNEALEFISIGLEDRAAYVRFETVQCVRSNMNSIPKQVLLKTLEILENLCNYSGWLINYFSNIEYNHFKEEVEQQLAEHS